MGFLCYGYAFEVGKSAGVVNCKAYLPGMSSLYITMLNVGMAEEICV